jgi:hypothetical protein
VRSVASVLAPLGAALPLPPRSALGRAEGQITGGIAS